MPASIRPDVLLHVVPNVAGVPTRSVIWQSRMARVLLVAKCHRFTI